MVDDPLNAKKQHSEAALEEVVVRPRFFWDDGNGRTGFLTGGVTYENRDGGTLAGAAVLPSTGMLYTEALTARRYDLGGNLQAVVQKRSLRLALQTQHQLEETWDRYINSRNFRGLMAQRIESR